jgi:hypothetical protein
MSFHCKVFFPISPLVRPHNSNGAAEKEERPEKYAAEFWPILFRKGRRTSENFAFI